MRIGSVVLSCLAMAVSASEPLIWVEGEAPTSGKGHPDSWYSKEVKTGELSGGAFLSSFTPDHDTEVDYEVAVAAPGDYRLWARVNPIQAKLSWRRDQGPWQLVDLSKTVDLVNIATDGKPDLRLLAWVQIATLTLKAGTTRIGFKFHSANHHHGALDCFVLTTGAFQPDGHRRPGAVEVSTEPGWFAFAPGQDGFAPTAIDLRVRNESRAGAGGWLTAKGDDLVKGDGTPLRLWAVNAKSKEGQDAADYLFARLAKSGVNCTRMHGLLADRAGADPFAVSKSALDDVHRNIKAAADQGIYVNLSTYFPLWIKLKASDGIDGGALGKNPFGLLLFEPRFQAMYKAWAKTVLTTRNPYTGKTPAEDPAVAFWEIQNEDSLFFWTMKKENLGHGPYRTLCGLFADWAARRHGSLAKAVAAWGDAHEDDDAAAGRLGLFGPWEMSRSAEPKLSAGRQRRVRDQIAFYAEQSRSTYAALADFLRRDCGFKGIITASNWITADNRRLAALERWTYAASTDAVDRHGYFSGKHEGDASGHSLRTGHTFTDQAAVLDPAATLLGYLQLAGRPHLFTEIAWSRPNRFIADGPLLTASYGALQGVDGYFAFAIDQGTWAAKGGQKWPVARPGVMGQWPAVALQYRRGDLAEGPVAVRQVVSAAAMQDLTATGLVEGASSDFRVVPATPDATAAADVDAAFDPLAYFTGRVERSIAGLPGQGAPQAPPITRDLSRAIDRDAKVVKSLNGELAWDWGRGLVTVASPRSQAVTGFLGKARETALPDVVIRCANEYGTVHVISLDDAPLKTAKRILVQAFTEEKLTGWRASGGRIEDTGGPPILVREIDASVTFGSDVATAVALDAHGQPAGDVAIRDRTIILPKDRLYVLVTR